MKKPSPGDVVAQHYRLTHVLGEGSTGLVFAAENVFTGKSVAIKWLFPSLLRERDVSVTLLREAQRNGEVAHPNVVNVTDVGRHDDSIFLVMELLQGKPLTVFLPDALVEPAAFLKLMMPALRGVQAAHEAGVVHGSLSPAKIFLSVDAHGVSRKIKVLDFGVTRLTRASHLSSSHGKTGGDTVQRAPHFIAPEQLHDPRKGDERSDIYALGVIVYRALSGVYPFEGETLSELATLVCDAKAIPLQQRVPRLQRGLGDVVMRTLQLEPQQRYQTVVDLASALEPYLDQPDASLTVLRKPVEHNVPRPQSTAESKDRASLRELGEWLVRDEGRMRARLPASGRMPPPPPPRSRPYVPEGVSVLHASTSSQPPRRSQVSSAHDRRGHPAKTTLALPPLPPSTSREDAEPPRVIAEVLTVHTTGRDEDCTASHRIDRNEQTHDPGRTGTGKQL